MSDTAEIWIPIAGYEGRYDISNFGRVRSWARKDGPHLRRLRTGERGYLNITLRRRKVWDCRAVHVLVAEAFLGPRPDGMVIRHLDGHSDNNVASNLAYGTPSENIYDQVLHGTHAWASRTSCSHGHPFTPENTYVNPTSGSRVCRECARRWQRTRSRARRRPRKQKEDING